MPDGLGKPPGTASKRGHSVVRGAVFVILGTLLFIDVVYTIAQISKKHLVQSGVGATFLLVNVLFVVAFARRGSD